MSDPNVSIIVLNYNGYLDTIECLESLFKMNYHDFKIVVVDNGSVNDSVERIKKWINTSSGAKGAIDLIENKNNEGFAKGNNIGIRYALVNHKCKYILTLNNDTTVEPDFLAILLDSFDKPNIALAGPRIIEPGRGLHFQGYFSNRLNFFNYIAFLTPLRQIFIKTPMSVEFKIETKKTPLKVYAIPGCCMLFKSNILVEVGMFDEKTFLGWEECIIAEKLFQAGYRTVVVPKSRIFHKVSRGFAKRSLLTRKNSYQESERYFQLNYLKMPSYQRRLIGLIRSLSHFLTVLLAGSAEKKAESI